MLKKMLEERNLPQLRSREEMLDILLKEEYGYMPPEPEGIAYKAKENEIRQVLAEMPSADEILNMLKGGRLSAGEINSRFPVTAASISRHLSVLKEADLIRDTREGKFIYYDLNASVLEEIMLWIKDLKD